MAIKKNTGTSERKSLIINMEAWCSAVTRIRDPLECAVDREKRVKSSTWRTVENDGQMVTA